MPGSNVSADAKLVGRPSWLPIGPEVYQERDVEAAAQTVLKVRPEPRWFTGFPHLVTKAEFDQYMAETEPNVKYQVEASPGEYPIPMLPPFPKSIDDLPLEDHGARLSLSAKASDDVAILQFHIGLTSGADALQREVEHRWSNTLPFLFAFYVDGRAATLPNHGWGRSGGVQGFVPLVTANGSRQWDIHVDAQRVRDLLPDGRRHSLAIVAAFCNSQHEGYSEGGRVELSNKVNGPSLILVRSEPAILNWDGSRWLPPKPLLATMQPGQSNHQIIAGAIVRGRLDERKIALVFTAHEFAESGEVILDQLARHHAKASFFFTGDFLDNKEYAAVIRRVVADGHYLGPHSDKHLLYCDWTVERKTLVTREQFRADVQANLAKIERLGIQPTDIRYFLPAFERTNSQIGDWSKEIGLTLINYTPGTRANSDYTGEADKNFVSSQTIYDSIIHKEQTDPHGLNGFILLLHLGAGPIRADKFADRFGMLLDYLQKRGYQFLRVDQLLDAAK
jgi:peptidoglycan/xylan/chitin deacetylase (PgdA/CDA1 family)